MKNLYQLVSVLILAMMQSSFAQSIVISGNVIDGNTKENLEFINVYLKKSKIGTTTDIKGNFTIKTDILPDTLMVSFIGYKNVKLFIPSAPKQKLNISLEENALLLNEVNVINYKDPGKHLMQMVIDHKNSNDIKRFDNSVFNEYRKTEVDIYNLDTSKGSGFFKNIASIYKTFKSDSVNNIAPIYFTEKFFRTYHSNNLQTNVEHLIATKQLGLSTDKLSNYLDKFELKINLYDGIIPILKTSFLSPVSAIGLLYYKFLPIDTIFDGNSKFIQLQVNPKIKNENTFTGYIWVEEDSYAITKYQLKTSKGSNINFVDNIKISQEFISIQNNVDSKKAIWLPHKFKTEVEFNNGLDLIGIPIKGDSTTKKIRLTNASIYNDYIINSESLNANNFYNESKNLDSLSANTNQLKNFDDVYRTEKLSEQEQAIYNTFDSLKTNKKFVRETKLTTLIATGYWDLGCKTRFGPYSSLLSTNLVEGLRIRCGFWTLPCLFKTFNVNGYAAYGFKDKVAKGGLGVKYVPSTKRFLKTELFVRSDFDLLLDFDDALDADNVFTLALRKNIPAYQVFTQQIKLLQEIDINHNWSAKAFIWIKTLNPTFDYTYYKIDEDRSIIDFKPLKKLAVNEFGIVLRYAHNERTTIFNYDKIRIASRFPIFTINYTYGFELTKNNYFEYHKIIANVSQEINLPIKGTLFYAASVGQLFGIVPALILFAPAGNAYYVSNKYTFNNMLPYEFAADRFASVMLRYNMGGILLGKVPFLNKLNLRERVIFNNYMGVMSIENRKYNNINPIKTTGLKPYSEAGVGIGNLFNVLSVDAIWRLSHFNSNLALTRFGIYTTLTLVF
jgi:hypothetical protein